MDIYEELGVNAYINANEWYTSQGGSMSAAPVVKAMAGAAHKNVNFGELQTAVDEAVARLTRNEAACVTSSATAGIVLSIGAFMAGLDPKRSEQLPDTDGLKDEVIMYACGRFDEDPAVRIPGARIVEIGDRDGATLDDLQNAITDQTAAVFTDPSGPNMIPLKDLTAVAHERDVGVIVDIAWALPPKENLWRFTEEDGADVVLVSGGKGLRGPQASGLILGKKAVVDACRAMASPNSRLGRPMKIGREVLVGMYAAVKHFVNGGAEQTQKMAAYIAEALQDIAGISVTVDASASHVHIHWSRNKLKWSRDHIQEKMLTGEPAIKVRRNGPDGIRVNAGTLTEGQEIPVAERLRDVFSNAMK